MIAAYVANGVKSGLVAGLVFGLLVALVANPLVAFAEGGAQVEHADEAGDHQHAGDHGHAGHSHEEGALPASLTDGVSVLSGVLWGVFLASSRSDSPSTSSNRSSRGPGQSGATRSAPRAF
ncbi:CbtA family protein [Halorubrum saccharovorum]|uniref:CbtA family protein n=1 Tax=Halorubrum saccharovorum TaxID=2248 RepID=UPI0006793342|nr:CbtA family protein [Halorubrum saccharovorum]